MPYTEATATIGIDEVGHPATLGKLTRLHQLESRLGVHNGIALLLVLYHTIDNLSTLLHIQSEILGTLEGGVEAIPPWPFGIQE